MTGEIAQRTDTDRLGLADLPELSGLLLQAETFRLRVAGWSMYPTLTKGDRLTVEPVHPEQLWVGDLVLFHHQGRLICHRLVAVHGTGPTPRLLTKGDATTGPGELLESDQVLGRVIAIERRRPRLLRGPRVGALAVRINHWAERHRQGVGLGLRRLQDHRSYRLLMRAMLSRCFAYSVGVPEGRRWYRYHPIRPGDQPVELKGHQRFHLVAKFGGTAVGSLHLRAGAAGFWLEALSVRLRYRGLGVASRLVVLAGDLAALGKARVLLAAVDAENQPSLRLFETLGFRPLPGMGGSGTTILARTLRGDGGHTSPIDVPEAALVGSSSLAERLA